MSGSADRQTDVQAPDLSVVVPTFDRVDRLRRVVDALLRQETTTAFEVIIVSDGSSDGTDDYLATLGAPVRSIRQDNAGPSVARNRGVDLARGELILFVDDDVVAGPGLVEAHVRAHAQRPESVVIGPMLNPPDHPMSPWVDWEQAKLAEQYDALTSGRFRTTARNFYTGNASIPRSLLMRVGGFDPSLRRAEDVELAIRLEASGCSFSFEPSAEAFHYAERSFASWCRIAYDYGHADVQFARRKGDGRIAQRIRRNFRSYPLVARWIALGLLDRPQSRQRTARLVRRIALASHRIHLFVVSRGALSLVYIAEYFRGVADELGGSSELRRHVAG